MENHLHMRQQVSTWRCDWAHLLPQLGSGCALQLNIAEALRQDVAARAHQAG